MKRPTPPSGTEYETEEESQARRRAQAAADAETQARSELASVTQPVITQPETRRETLPRARRSPHIGAGVAAPPTTRGGLTHWTRRALLGYLFALPWFIGFIALTLGPMIFSLYASFTNYNIVSSPVWTGLGNYRFILQFDDRFRISLYNTLYYVIVKTPIVIALSLLFAVLLNQPLPGKRVLRTIYYLPTVITGVAAIFLWIWVLNPVGLLNRTLAIFGLPGPNWFYDPVWAKPGLIVMSLWYLGSPILIFLAGLQDVPDHLYEAAEIDGAGKWAQFLNITVPMLSPTIFFQVVTQIIGAFQVFNTAFVVSTTAHTVPGAPAESLLFYAVYLYLRAFQQLQMGFASALAWILFIIVMAVTLVQIWFSNRWVYYRT